MAQDDLEKTCREIRARESPRIRGFVAYTARPAADTMRDILISDHPILHSHVKRKRKNGT